MNSISFLSNILQKKKKLSIYVEGKSMYPTLHPQDKVYLSSVTFSRVKLNDIVMVRKSGKAYVHRVIYKRRDYIITKGDNNTLSDGKIHANQFIGKVFKIERQGLQLFIDDIYLVQSTQYYQEIINLMRIWEEKGLNFVFLKGLPLHLYFENKYPARLFADCDVLFSAKDRRKVKEIFQRFEYKMAEVSYSKVHKRLKDKLTEITYYKNNLGFPVIFDIHYEPVFLMNQLGKLEELYSQKMIDRMKNEFLETKMKITVLKENFPILNSSLSIMYLALHFFHHNYKGIYRLEFLDKVIKKSYRESFELFSDLSEKIVNYKLQNFVFPVFLLLKKYYGTSFPSFFLKSIKPKEAYLKFVFKKIMTTDVFSGESRISAGINRFMMIFRLSPQPTWKKIRIFFNPAVLYTLFWLLFKILSNIRGYKKQSS